MCLPSTNDSSGASHGDASLLSERCPDKFAKMLMCLLLGIARSRLAAETDAHTSRGKLSWLFKTFRYLATNPSC